MSLDDAVTTCYALLYASAVLVVFGLGRIVWRVWQWKQRGLRA